jgi:non-ribosomal peptide synthetase component F
MTEQTLISSAAGKDRPDSASPPAVGHQLPLAADVLPLHERTVPRAFARAMARVPDQAALIEPLGRTITYRELDCEARRIAASLRELGLAPGDNVLAMLDPHADNVVGWLAANIASVVWVPINTSYKGSLLQFVVEHSEARAIIIEQEWVDRISQIATHLTFLRTVIVRGSLNDVTLPAGLEVRTYQVLQAAEPVEMEEPRVMDVSTIMYTSGTEGQAKGVLIPMVRSMRPPSPTSALSRPRSSWPHCPSSTPAVCSPARSRLFEREGPRYCTGPSRQRDSLRTREGTAARQHSSWVRSPCFFSASHPDQTIETMP